MSMSLFSCLDFVSFIYLNSTYLFLVFSFMCSIYTSPSKQKRAPIVHSLKKWYIRFIVLNSQKIWLGRRNDFYNVSNQKTFRYPKYNHSFAPFFTFSRPYLVVNTTCFVQIVLSQHLAFVSFLVTQSSNLIHFNIFL